MDSSSSKRPSTPAVRFTLANMASPSPVPKDIFTNKSPQVDPSYVQNTSQVNRSQVAFTPIMTPGKGDRSGSMVLLSPARTIKETVTTLVSSTSQQLEGVWDEVGYSPEDRAVQLSDLLIQFRNLCEKKLAEEKGVAETFRQTISDAKEEITKTAKCLNTKVDPQILKEVTGQTLTDELATLEASLEGLRLAANASKEDLKECQDFLIEAHKALGIEMDDNWKDIDTDLTNARRKAFHRKKDEMKEELSTRTAAVIQLVRDCQHLINALHLDTGPGGSEIDRRIVGSIVRSKDDSFIMASKFRSDSCVGICSTALEELTSRVAELHGEKKRRQKKLTDMGAEISLLWEKLRIPEEVQRSFTESVQGIGMKTIEKGEKELSRLHGLKSQMLGELIEEAREKIQTLWKQIEATPKQRQSFEEFNIKTEIEMTEELLERHDDYIGKLELRLEQMKPIRRLIERREIIVRERMEYENLQKDSDRLKTRGAALTRQLMEEEKMARRIKRDLPRLTELLTEQLLEWKESHNEDFLYGGQPYLDAMDRQEEEWSQYKANELLRKQKMKEEKSYGEKRHNVFNSRHHLAKKTARPLVDARSKNNVKHLSRGLTKSERSESRTKGTLRHPSRGRSFDITNLERSENRTRENFQHPSSRSRGHHSHDIARPQPMR